MVDSLELFARLRRVKLPVKLNGMMLIAVLIGDVWNVDGEEEPTVATTSEFYTVYRSSDGIYRLISYCAFDPGIRMLDYAKSQTKNIVEQLDTDYAMKKYANKEYVRLTVLMNGNVRRTWCIDKTARHTD